jgi:pyruvate dehydrogenase E2 component (dihydrolipoamide acetyltransferase)
MAIPITIPRLGWTMDEGVFAGWLKADGDRVGAGDSLFSLEGEKATEEIECLDEGILRIPPNGPRPGDKVAVGAVIGALVQPGEAAPWESSSPRAAPAHAESAEEKTVSSAPVSRLEKQEERRRTAISPRARRVAGKLGIDWTTLRGSGRTGRIRERDVRAAASGATPPQATAVPLGSIRKTTGERLLASLRSTAPVTLTTTADATNLVNLRKQFTATVLAQGNLIPGYTDFLVKLTACALQEHPSLNAVRAGDRVVTSPAVHVGIAVDTDAGLLVPVVRDVSSLSLKQVTARARELIERARQGRLRAEEMQGGTFTVTNLGAFGIDAFTPILNPPQCAILGIGHIVRRPVVRGVEIVARELITLSLTFDHRLVDGAPAARFLQTLSRIIENPGPWLVS